MIYAWRVGRTYGRMLVEFKSVKEMDSVNAANASQGGAEPYFYYEQASRQQAHAWVKAGNNHETGLWVDGTRVRYAPADPDY